MTSNGQDSLNARDYLTLLRPALPHLVRLEAYFRINGLDDLSEDLERALNRAEEMLANSARIARSDGAEPPVGDNDDAHPSDDRDQSRYNAASMPERRDRAALG